MNEAPTLPSHLSESARYRVTGMDCSSCAAKIEKATRQIAGVRDVKVSIATQVMTVQTEHATQLLPVEQAVASLGYQLARIDQSRATSEAGVNELRKDLSHVSPHYRRALWIVVLLNLGYGVVELIAGFAAGSQSLKADALDFLGDGSITFLSILAIGWSLATRARAAMAQGLFLAALGVGVLCTTAYRVFFLNEPNPELMGAFGAVALAINIVAAVVLLPHRTGDANVRAVWLFSRNDAMGNAAVVVAAGLVAWTGTPWPDLAVAVVIAALFLHSAVSIINDARSDLKPAHAG